MSNVKTEFYSTRLNQPYIEPTATHDRYGVEWQHLESKPTGGSDGNRRPPMVATTGSSGGSEDGGRMLVLIIVATALGVVISVGLCLAGVG